MSRHQGLSVVRWRYPTQRAQTGARGLPSSIVLDRVMDLREIMMYRMITMGMGRRVVSPIMASMMVLAQLFHHPIQYFDLPVP
jgi:hypothetical protein